MRKQVFGRHLSRGRNARKALFRSLVRSLVEHGAIKTTAAKAKSVQVEVDRLMKLVRVNSVTSKRSAMAVLGNDRKTLESLFAKYLSATNQRTSGFTRIIKLGTRRGDLAKIVKLEMVDQASVVVPVVKEKKTKTVKVKKEAKPKTEVVTKKTTKKTIRKVAPKKATKKVVKK